MNKKIRDNIFLVICCALIFNNVPEAIQLNSIGGVMGKKLLIYPLLVGFVYTAYCQYKYKNNINHFKIFKRFILFYICIMILSLLVGICVYPYYDLILYGPIDQIEKMSKLINILQYMDISVEYDLLVILWMIIRNIKNLLLEIIYTFGGAYMIFCWYYNEWKQGIAVLKKSIVVSLIIIFLYSSIEIFYLSGNKLAENILINITPYFHYVEEYGTWWPPLLWRGQLRSIFEEPSYFGMYATFIMPMLWYKIINLKKNNIILFCCVMVMFCFCLFLTKARTAVCLFLGEMFLLTIIVLYFKNINLYKKYAMIILCSVIAFIGANIFISNIMNSNNNDIVNLEVNEYISNNITSIASTEQRSNNTRYSIMIADLKLGLDYPILGVGYNLRSAYIPNYLPEMSRNNKEVNTWINEQHNLGVLKKSIPKLGEYTSRFSETGILGLIIFLIPSIILLKSCIIKLFYKKIEYQQKLMYAFFLISFIGVLMIGLGDTINNTYYYWVLLGLGYAMCFGKPGDDIKHE